MISLLRAFRRLAQCPSPAVSADGPSTVPLRWQDRLPETWEESERLLSAEELKSIECLPEAGKRILFEEFLADMKRLDSRRLKKNRQQWMNEFKSFFECHPIISPAKLLPLVSGSTAENDKSEKLPNLSALEEHFNQCPAYRCLDQVSSEVDC